MSLIQTIQGEVKAAMIARDAKRRDALRFLLNALQTEEKSKRAPLTEDEEINILSREAKRRNESIASFQEANRQDMVDAEAYELTIIQEFLPKPLSASDVSALIVQIAEEHSISEKKGMGLIMKHLSPLIRGRFDGREAKNLVDAFFEK